MARNEAPISDRVIDDSAKCRPVWVEYFASLSNGDVGTTWTPTITNLTSVGTPTISGVYYQNQGFTDFFVKIVPGTNTSSTAGSTAFTLPFNVVADAACHAVTGNASVPGAVNASSKTVYPPSWSNLTTPVTISGRVKN